MFVFCLNESEVFSPRALALFRQDMPSPSIRASTSSFLQKKQCTRTGISASAAIDI